MPKHDKIKDRLHDIFESEKMGSKIIDKRETLFFDILPLDSIWDREHRDRSFFERRDSITREVTSKIRQIIIVSDDHENRSIFFGLLDDIQIDSI